MSDDESGDGRSETDLAVVLDVLPHGRTGDDRPQYQKPPLAYALREADFELLELELAEDADVAIGDRISVDGEEASIERSRRVNYDDLSSGARSELDYAVEEVVDADEERFVDFYNEAQPITLRLHQLNLLPGIGKKLRNNILDERKRRPFESFADLEKRVDGLHNPEEVLVDRVIEELRETDLKYRTFVRRED